MYVHMCVTCNASLLQDVGLQIRRSNVFEHSVLEMAIDKGRQMQRRVEFIMIIVFVTFVFRATFACMHAYSFVGIVRYEFTSRFYPNI